jgi:mRNA-degrading endonuclease toxin of MazEF toxin-antitoxin module
MLRGEIWLGVWPSDPEKKGRPLLIVSNNHRNKAQYILDIVVVKLTSLQRKDLSEKPTNPAEDFVVTLKKPTIIRCASIFAVEKIALKSKISQLTAQQMSGIDSRLKTALDLN